MLQLAMLGAWHVHAPDYAQQIHEHTEAEIALVWDHDPKRGNKFAQELNVPFVSTLEESLGKNIDGVVINTPTTMHHEVIIAAAKQGKHIFTEKVLATTVEESEEIATVIRKSDVKFAISYPHRTLPHNLFAKDIVEQGVLGEISLLRIRNAHAGTSLGWLPEHFYNYSETGGGAMMDLGAHGMYLASWLLGEPHRISAVFNHLTDKEVEDNAVAVIEFKNKAIAINETSFVSDRSPFALELYGTKGSLLIGGPDNTIQLNASGLSNQIDGWIKPQQLPEALPSALEQWIGGILRNETIHFDLGEALMLTLLMDGAYRSHHNGMQIYF